MKSRSKVKLHLGVTKANDWTGRQELVTPLVCWEDSRFCCGIYEGSLVDSFDEGSAAERESALASLVEDSPATCMWFSDYKGGPTDWWIKWVKRTFPGCVHKVMSFMNSKTGNIITMWAVHLDKIQKRSIIVKTPLTKKSKK